MSTLPASMTTPAGLRIVWTDRSVRADGSFALLGDVIGKRGRPLAGYAMALEVGGDVRDVRRVDSSGHVSFV